MRKPIIVGNWKMNKTINEALAFIKEVEPHMNNKEATVGIGCSFIALNDAKKAAKNLIVSAQNVHFKKDGAYTGEISIDMLKDVNIEYCIIGHSERREMFNETDETVNQKALALLANNITPILCMGETLAQFEAGETETVVRNQTIAGFANIAPEDVAKVVIAYEPIWAIGTGKTATSEIAQNTCAIIRDQIAKLYTQEIAQAIRIQYGGSVKPDNIAELMDQPDIDGALIGGASLDANSFNAIIDLLK